MLVNRILYFAWALLASFVLMAMPTYHYTGSRVLAVVATLAGIPISMLPPNAIIFFGGMLIVALMVGASTYFLWGSLIFAAVAFALGLAGTYLIME